MKYCIRYFYFLYVVVVLCACSPKKWKDTSFKQIKSFSSSSAKEYVVKMRNFIRLNKIYKRFSSVIEVAALMMTNEAGSYVADFYNELHSVLVKNRKQKSKELVTYNEKYISFYVLASQPLNRYISSYSLFAGIYSKNEYLFTGDTPYWSISLKINENEYLPVEIKEVELPLEIIYCFGRDFSQFKKSYKISFSLYDEAGKKIISSFPASIKLNFKSLSGEFFLHWNAVKYHENNRFL